MTDDEYRTGTWSSKGLLTFVPFHFQGEFNESLTHLSTVLSALLVVSACNGLTVQPNPSPEQRTILSAVNEQVEELHQIVSTAIEESPVAPRLNKRLGIGSLSIGINSVLSNDNNWICASCVDCDLAGNCRAVALCCRSGFGSNDPCPDGDLCPDCQLKS